MSFCADMLHSTPKMKIEMAYMYFKTVEKNSFSILTRVNDKHYLSCPMLFTLKFTVHLLFSTLFQFNQRFSLLLDLT